MRYPVIILPILDIYHDTLLELFPFLSAKQRLEI